MLYESPHLRVEADDGVATLWLEFAGSPVNALTPPRLAELGRALDAVLPDPHLEILLIRSGRPAGFCGGHDPAALAGLTTEDAQTAFAVAGQRVLNRLAAAEAVSLAFIEGPCLGPGVELALACDHRLAVAGPDSVIGFPDAANGLPPCWGGAARLKRLLGRRAKPLLAGATLTVREAVRVGLVDHACCARRGRIDLRTFLDRLQFRPRKRSRAPAAEGLAAERVAFRAALRSCVSFAARPTELSEPVPPFPALIGLIGESEWVARLAVEVALRGTAAAIAGGGAGVAAALAEAVRRGRATPLEADQARGRIRAGADVTAAGWVIAAESAALPFVEPTLRPRTLLAVPAARLPDVARHATRPDRVVGLDIADGRASVTAGPGTNSDTVAAVAAWVRRLGFSTAVREPPTSTAARRAA